MGECNERENREEIGESILLPVVADLFALFMTPPTVVAGVA